MTMEVLAALIQLGCVMVGSTAHPQTQAPYLVIACPAPLELLGPEATPAPTPQRYPHQG